MRVRGSATLCGIVGILGREPVAGQLVDALKRLEYRGYDSAGVATLEQRRADAPARRGQAAQPRDPAAAASRSTARSASATPAGRPTAGRPRATPIRTPPTASRSCTTASSRISASCATSWRSSGAKFEQRDRHRGRRPSRHRRDEEGQVAGRGGGGGAAAAARRLRARLPVRRRGRPADRRPQGLAARGRLRRRRDVSRLRRHRARAVHRHDHLSRGRRLGGADAQGRRDPRRRRARWSSARCIKSNASAFLVDKGNHRHFMAKEIHEQPEVVGHTLAHYLDMANERVALPMDAAVRLQEARADVDLGLRHGLLRRPGRQILVRALRAAAGRDRRRLRVPLPRGAARSRAISRSSSRNRARPPTRWRRCAMPRSRSSTSSRSSTCRPRPSRARATW